MYSETWHRCKNVWTWELLQFHTGRCFPVHMDTGHRVINIRESRKVGLVVGYVGTVGLGLVLALGLGLVYVVRNWRSPMDSGLVENRFYRFVGLGLGSWP